MNKKVLATAMGAVLAGSMSFAQAGDVTLYGNVNISINAVDIDGGEEEMKMDDEPMADEPMADEEELMEEDELSEALSGITYVPGREEIVNEVAKRVAKRLVEAKKAQAKLQEALGGRRRTQK